MRQALERRYPTLRRRGSHQTFAVGEERVTFAYHDGVELAERQLRNAARQFGLTLAELKDLI